MRVFHPFELVRPPLRAIVDVGVMLFALVLLIWPLLAAFLVYRLVVALL